MKKVFFALCATVTLSTAICNAQVAKRYNATYSTGAAYTQLTGATDLFGVNWDDAISDPITLPFPFKYQNTTVNDVIIGPDNNLFLNQYMGKIIGPSMDYTSAGRGRVLYTTTGAAGNRIFKVEYRNVGRFKDTVGTDTLNFQIWLYENGNAIEFRGGYSNMHDRMFAHNAAEAEAQTSDKEVIRCGLIGNPGDSIDLMSTNAFIHATQYITTFKDTAMLLTSNPDLNMVNREIYGSFPANGSVIRFAPVATTGVSAIDFDMATVYPNPSRDGQYTISLKEAPKAGATLTVYDMTGKVVLNQTLNQAATKIDLGAYANGNYFGKITNGDRTGSFKLIKE